MTRLIDVDTLHIFVSGGRHNGKREFADAVEKAIKEVPEVEAIPISWLEDFRDHLDMLSERGLMNAIDLLIMAYRVERKREEYDGV